MNYEIEKLPEKDIEQCLKHIKKHAKKNGIEYPPKRVQTFREVLQKFTHDDKSGLALVVYDNNKIIASAMIDIFYSFDGKNTKEAEIMGIYVSDKFQGQGIAKAMMHQLFDFARNNQVARIYLYARTPSAKGLYKKLGFTQLLPDEYNGRVTMFLDCCKIDI